MNKASYELLRPDAIEYIEAVTGINMPQASRNIPGNFPNIDQNMPITASFFDGGYKSLFKDNIWIISESLQINFNTGVDRFDAHGIHELKTLSYLFLEIPFAWAEGQYRTLLAPKTVFIRTATLKALKNTESLKGRSLISVFADNELSNQLAREIQNAEKNKLPNFSLIISNLQGILGHIKFLSNSYLNIEIASSDNLYKVLQAAYTRARASSEQHTVIPPVIYSQIYSDAIEIINNWDANKFDDDVQCLISAYTDLSDTGSNSYKIAGVSRTSYQNRLRAFLAHEEQTYLRPGNRLFFQDKVKKVGQVDESSFFYGSKNITGILFEIRRIQAFLARLILQETTMREEELRFLLNEPTKIVNTPKGTVFTIQGKETKISGGVRESWVVSKNAKKAHDILRQLSDFSYQIQVINKPSPKWLFPKISLAIVDKGTKNIAGVWTAPNGVSVPYKNVDKKPASITSLFKFKFKSDDEGEDESKCECEELNSQWLDRTGDYILSSTDVNFLHMYGSSKNRLNSNVSENQVFSITEHQFRRSLPFYASASDLLSMSDLKHQLKHIAIVTTYYYADGGIALKESGLLLDDETYAELNKSMKKDQAQTDIILRKELINILDDSRNTLFGPGRNAVKHFTESIKLSSDPEKEFADLAKEHAIKTKQLPHGWCITTKPCDDYANQKFDQCFNCANGVLDRDKTIALIKEVKAQAKSAKNEFNKNSFKLLGERIEKAATSMYPNLFDGQI